MHDRVQAVALFGERVGGQKLIEGWIEGPCAEAADLRGINRLMTDFFDDPPFVRDLFEFVLEMELAFARAQVEAGADLIGVGDAAASLVGPRIYEEFVWPYEQKMVDGLHALGARVRLHICGNIRRILGGMGSWAAKWWTSTRWSRSAQARQEMGPQQRAGRQPRPGGTRLRNGTPAGDHRRHRRVPPPGRSAVHRRRRLRSAPRHAAGEPAAPCAITPARTGPAVKAGEEQYPFCRERPPWRSGRGTNVCFRSRNATEGVPYRMNRINCPF